jgi:regulator of nonsense transcripts 1
VLAVHAFHLLICLLHCTALMRLLLTRVQVIVTTCNGAGERRLQRQSFRVVVMDEASQATEPASLVPLLKGAECVVMAGDQRQLPPTVISQRAVE